MTHDGRLSLPESEMAWRFSRSSGAGGQHVNTTDTRVELIWSLDDTSALSPTQKELVRQRLSNRLVDGTITVVSSQYRSQHRNREAARVRLEDLVSGAMVPSKPRRPTRPSRGAKQRRIDAKKRRGSLKQGRSGSWE
ncbi:aminoacyl-tRNA hydrolase [Aeromicrobium sp. A1-2]|uniref:alternative ribosome rescue aminoacyl-tRNA hydrolase ArfB n=1 Tax=Aeromicrobium sp. A1-2 TaxID=2107713 RepID=UPI000E5332D7|nr:alternative ribosome rescue aminoacyl-tRNA hydrolase ArfB [Aeromicrobium sp. A1-2]AXT85611.1 aminoacyl-tRNA hydrolase [Aeromicrobium sp. A1-2]